MKSVGEEDDLRNSETGPQPRSADQGNRDTRSADWEHATGAAQRGKQQRKGGGANGTCPASTKNPPQGGVAMP
eukprot:7975531-Alexandrium_andersonii.AAC.1